MRTVDERIERAVLEGGHGAERIEALEEQGLALDDVADAGQGPLRQQGALEGSTTHLSQPAPRLLAIERVGRRVGAELLDGARLQPLDDWRVEAHGDEAVVGMQLEPGLEGGPSPALAFAIDVPRSVEHHVRAQRPSLFEADEEVLAARGHLLDALAEWGAAEIAVEPRHAGADQRLAQGGGGAKDGVALRHLPLPEPPWLRPGESHGRGERASGSPGRQP